MLHFVRIQSNSRRITPNITATPQLASPSPQLSEEDIRNSASSSGHLPYAKQYELGDEPQRKKFLDTFKDFMEQNGTPCLRVPMADNTNNIPLDLYKLYREVCRRNGMPEVNNKYLERYCSCIIHTRQCNQKSTKRSAVCLKLPLCACSSAANCGTSGATRLVREGT